MRLLVAALLAAALAALAGQAGAAFWIDPATRFEVTGVPAGQAVLILSLQTDGDRTRTLDRGLMNGDTVFLAGPELARDGKTWVQLNDRNEYWTFWIRKDFLKATVLPPPEFRVPLTCAEGGANWGNKAVISAGGVTISKWYLSDSDDGTDVNTTDTYAIGEPVKSGDREWAIAAAPEAKPYSAKVLDISTCVGTDRDVKRYYYEDSLGLKLCCE